MVKIFTVTWLLCFAGLSYSVAQQIKPTSEDEYNYGAVGYRIQLQTRLGDKPGYEVRDGEGCSYAERKIDFKYIFRTGESIPCATIVIYSRGKGSPNYYCIPSADASVDLWEKFRSSLSSGMDNPSEQMHFFTFCLSKILSEKNYK